LSLLKPLLQEQPELWAGHRHQWAAQSPGLLPRQPCLPPTQGLLLRLTQHQLGLNHEDKFLSMSKHLRKRIEELKST
ncbi:unnamed protein product, partial [Coccothraustes coccothraustes]